jgi:hypothetical protein
MSPALQVFPNLFASPSIEIQLLKLDVVAVEPRRPFHFSG